MKKIIIIANTLKNKDDMLSRQIKERCILNNRIAENGMDSFLWMGEMTKTDFNQTYLDAMARKGDLYLFWNDYSDIFHFFSCLNDNVHAGEIMPAVSTLLYIGTHDRIETDLKHRTNLLKKNGISPSCVMQVDMLKCITPFDMNVFVSPKLIG